MEMGNLYESLSLIKPEISVSIFLILLVTFDLIFDKDKKFIPYIAIAGIFITGIFVIGQFSVSGFGFNTENVLGSPVGMVAVDSFGAFFKIIILVSSLLVVFFSYSSEEIEQSKDRLGEYYALIFGMILGMMVMISASDLILIYLSLELLSLSSYVLAGFVKLRERNSEASLKYLIYGAVSSGLMLFGISIIYGLIGSTNLYQINSALQTSAINPLVFSFAVILIVAGIGYKISAAPFHFWTPDVYEGAPISITAYLSVASKAAGFALLIRFVYTTFVINVEANGNWALVNIFDWRTLLIVLSIATMTLGNFSALWQNNLKRMLAYSSIAHAGYLLLGLVVLSNQGVMAILIYFAFYLLMNLGAFYCVMLIANKIGSEDIHDYKGLGYSSPFLGISLTIFLVSLTGLPPTAGFIGKLYIFIALVDAQMIVVAVIALLNTVVSLYYYVRVFKNMYLVKPDSEPQTVTPSLLSKTVILALIIPVLVFGLYFTPIVELARNSISFLGL
ncbi:MAG: NADH-quinone oxidoreductase subunit N [Bacteroidetes bacterium]|nr:NADH-quinone oxidoreductase subunit N [Bacteroidota bacterium]